MIYKAAADAFDKVRDEHVVGVDPNTDLENPFAKDKVLQIDFESLQTQNPDVIGWIHIPTCNVSYPIMYGSDYLQQNTEKEYSYSGSIFVGDSGSPSFELKNNIIHGHNMKDGSMFAGVRNASIEEIPYFYIYNPDGSMSVYETVYVGRVDELHPIYYSTFSDEESFQEYIDMEVGGSYNSRDALEIDDKLATLSTCTTTDSSRSVVQGVLVSTVP